MLFLVLLFAFLSICDQIVDVLLPFVVGMHLRGLSGWLGILISISLVD